MTRCIDVTDKSVIKCYVLISKKIRKTKNYCRNWQQQRLGKKLHLPCHKRNLTKLNQKKTKLCLYFLVFMKGKTGKKSSIREQENFLFLQTQIKTGKEIRFCKNLLR